MGQRVDFRRVKSHWTMTIQEWSLRLGVHKNTIQRWIKKDGLEAITDQRPFLIRGVDLKVFLKAQKKTKRFNCGTGQMPCFACNGPRRPADGLLDYVPTSITSGRLTGLCETCLTPMNRMIRRGEIARLFPNCTVTVTQCQGTLCGSTPRPVNGDLREVRETPQQEHRQLETKKGKNDADL